MSNVINEELWETRYEQGYEAFANGVSRRYIPVFQSDEEVQAWETGWIDSYRERCL